MLLITSSFSIKDERMKLNKACPLRPFFYFLNPAFDLPLSELLSPQINPLSYLICVTASWQALCIQHLPLAPSRDATPPSRFNCAHEYLICAVSSNPPLDKDPIWACRARAVSTLEGVHTRRLLHPRDKQPHICICFSLFFTKERLFEQKGRWSV